MDTPSPDHPDRPEPGSDRRIPERAADEDSLLALVSEFSAALVAAVDVSGVCANALAVLDRFLGWRIGLVFLRPGEQERLIRVFSREVPDSIAPLLQEVPIDASTQAGMAALRREPLVVACDEYTFPRLGGRLPPELVGSLVSIPLVARDQLVGVLDAFSPVERDVPAWLRSSLGTLGRLMGLALANARLFDQVVRANEHIRRVNKELEDFTYVVSHDLKEPLRTIQSFCNILETDYGAAFDDMGREILGAIVGSSERLRHLVDDLLTLSRIGRKLGPLVDIDMELLGERVVRLLEASVTQRKAEVRVLRPMPPARGDVNLVEVVVTNLLSNALKFHKGTPCIEIGAVPPRAPAERGGRERARPSLHTYFVRDDGIGIAPDFHEAVFAIFRRLHPRDVYEGTGAGLTIARRIIDAHGGRIWVESKEGEGATFYFSLPVAQGGDEP